MVKSKNLLGNKVLLLLAFVLFAIGFSIINNVFLVFGQTSYPQWRGTSNIKAPYLAENLDYLYQKINNFNTTIYGMADLFIQSVAKAQGITWVQNLSFPDMIYCNTPGTYPDQNLFEISKIYLYPGTDLTLYYTGVNSNIVLAMIVDYGETNAANIRVQMNPQFSSYDCYNKTLQWLIDNNRTFKTNATQYSQLIR